MASDGLAQDALGLRLRDEQHERVTALDMPEVETEHALAAAVDATESPSVAKPEHLLGQTALLEEFERARLDADGSRRRGRRFTLVDEAYAHSHARQFQRSREAGRPSANDQDRIRSGRGRIRELSFAFHGQFSLFHYLSPPECCLPLQRHRAMHWPLYSISKPAWSCAGLLLQDLSSEIC